MLTDPVERARWTKLAEEQAEKATAKAAKAKPKAKPEVVA
jgi:hypothetical protein